MNDEELLRLFEAREHSRIEHNSLISEAKARGRAEVKAEVAARMLKKGFDRETISDVADLSLDEVDRIARENGL